MKSYAGKINTNFHDSRMPTEGPSCIFQSVILINSTFKMGND